MHLAKFFWVLLPLSVVGGLMIGILGPLSLIPGLGKIFDRWIESYVSWVESL
jgi:hypothetical protein